MTDAVEVTLPEGVMFLQGLGGPKRLLLTAEQAAELRRQLCTGRGFQPLKWTARGRWSPESVRGAHANHYFPTEAVVAMLDAADEAHKVAIYAENDKGGEARGVVADVARALDVDIDEGAGHRWDLDHMRRVVFAAMGLRAELRRVNADRDSLTFRAEAAEAASLIQERELERAQGRLELASMFDHQTAPEDAALRATIVRQANEITALKGELPA